MTTGAKARRADSGDAEPVRALAWTRGQAQAMMTVRMTRKEEEEEEEEEEGAGLALVLVLGLEQGLVLEPGRDVKGPTC